MLQKLLAVLLCLSFLTACASPAGRQETAPLQKKKTLRLEVNANLGQEVVEQADAFADRVEKISGGALRIDANLGEPSIGRLARNECDLALLPNTELANIDSLFSMFSLPFMYENDRHMEAALNSKELLALLQARAPEGMPLPLAAIDSGDTALVTVRQQTKEPESFSDWKIAMDEANPDRMAVFRALGARVTPTAAAELPAALDRQASQIWMDAAEMTAEQIKTLPISTEGLYYVRTYHGISPLWLTISRDCYKSLSGYEQAVLSEAAAGLIAGMEITCSNREREQLAWLKAHGMQVLDVERQQLAASVYDDLPQDYTQPTYFDKRIYDMIQMFS